MDQAIRGHYWISSRAEVHETLCNQQVHGSCLSCPESLYLVEMLGVIISHSDVLTDVRRPILLTEDIGFTEGKAHLVDSSSAW